MGISFRKHIDSFEQVLQQVDIDTVSTSSYCKRYLAHILDHRHYFLKMYAQVLELSAMHTRKKISDMVLLDYGAGNGLLGLFAKHAGFGKVMINDIDPVFVEGSRNLARQLGIPVESFITGGMESVSKDIKPDIIAGTDVIEHIYDLPRFFRDIRALNPTMVTAFSTAANMYNPVKRKRIMRLQEKDETIGSDPSDAVLAGETAHPAFREIRKDIIRTVAPQLSETETGELITATRGLNEQDIRMAVDMYLQEKRMPQPPAHPTNTCHPLTGSWTEHLLSKEEYAEIYKEAGFGLTIHNGFYDTNKKTVLKSLVSQFLNAGVLLTGHILAPYLVLVGKSTVINEI